MDEGSAAVEHGRDGEHDGEDIPVTHVYHTPTDASTLVPELERTFTKLLQLRQRMRALYESLDARGFAPDREGLDFVVLKAGGPAVLRDMTTFRALLETVRDEFTSLATRGIVVKDLDVGLVDIYAEHQGREIFLCWRLGEKDISHWHEVDEGYRGRRHVSELVAALLP